MAKPTQFLINPMGKQVPVGTVCHLDSKKNEVVCDLVQQAKALQAHIEAQKKDMQRKLNAYMIAVGDEYGVTPSGEKGNLTLHSFDGSLKVLINVNERTMFESDRLSVARQLFLSCFRAWTKRGRKELRAMIENAFNTDKQGRVNQFQLMRILRIESNDKTFMKAQKALADALTTIDSKSYMRFYERDERGNWRSINLNFSGL